MIQVTNAELFLVMFLDVIFKWCVFGKPFYGIHPIVTCFGTPFFDQTGGL